MFRGARLMELEESNLDSRMKKLLGASNFHPQMYNFNSSANANWVMWGDPEKKNLELNRVMVLESRDKAGQESQNWPSRTSILT